MAEVAQKVSNLLYPEKAADRIAQVGLQHL